MSGDEESPLLWHVDFSGVNGGDSAVSGTPKPHMIITERYTNKILYKSQLKPHFCGMYTVTSPLGKNIAALC